MTDYEECAGVPRPVTYYEDTEVVEQEEEVITEDYTTEYPYF